MSDGNLHMEVPSKPELKITGKTVNKGTAGLPSVYDWNLKGRDVADLKVRLLLAQNGKSEVVQEFDYEELPADFANKLRLEVKDAARSPKGRRVNAVLFVESPVPSSSATVNEDKGLSIDVEAPFGNKMERSDLEPIEPGQTELLLALSYWKGDMTHDLSMESMTAATNGGNATFLFVTLDWSPSGEDKPGDSEVDLGLLQGEWETESLTESGKQLAAADGFGGLLLQIKGNTFVIAERKSNGEKFKVDTGRIVIDSTTSPKTIDFIGRDQPTIGIYELKDGVLRVCVVEQGGTEALAGERIPEATPLKRPRTFDSPVGSNIMLMEFTRSESAQEHDVSTIQGTWQVTYSEDSGRIAPQEMLKDLRFVIDEQYLTTEIGGRKSVATYKLDPSTNPKSIDLTENGRTKQAIYDLVGDTLRICIAESGEQRPTAFDSQPNSANDIVLILKRVKPDNASADGTEDQKHNGPLSEELARSLIPTAASISNEDFQKLQTNPAAQTIKNKSLSLALAPSNSQLDNVDLPGLAISPDITSLVWVDVPKVTTEKIHQSLASLLDAAPPEKREWANEVIAQCRSQVRPGFTALEKGTEAGIEVLVMGEKTNPAKAVAADVEDALDFVQNALTAIEGGLDAEDFDAEVPEPTDSKTGQLFVRMRPDTNPEDAIAIMVETFITEARVIPGSEEAQALEQVKAMEFVEIGGNWFAVRGKKVLQPRDQALDIAPFVKALDTPLFVEALEKHKGAAIRFAWLMDDETRAEFDRAQLESGALSFGGLLTSLQEMQSTSGGIWLGQRPEIALDMEFANQEDAQLFKATFEKLVGSVGRIAAIGTDDPEEKLQAEQIRAGLSLLFLDRDKARLSKTFDIALLQRLTAAGLPWTRLFEPDSADESEKSDVVSEPPAGSIETPADEKRSPEVENDR